MFKGDRGKGIDVNVTIGGMPKSMQRKNPELTSNPLFLHHLSDRG